MRIKSITLISLLLTLPAMALDTKSHSHIARIKAAFQTNSKTTISEHIRFPLHMDYPIPPVTKDDFVKRFDEIFDNELIRLIAQSDVNSDWSDVGWRGTMLHDGIAWVDFENKITHLNYTTETAKTLRAKLIANDKEMLHLQLQHFELPISEWITSKYRIRVDQMSDRSYRYSRWMKDASKSALPHLMIPSGTIQYEGSGGNHAYRFIDGDVEIVCNILVIGKDDSPLAEIRVFNNGEIIEYDEVSRPNEILSK